MLTFTVTASDGDVPPTPLTFALVSGPAGLTMNNQGLVRWVPTEEQGPSTNIVLVKVTDNGVPQKSTTNSLVVVVQEVNLNPVLTVVEPQAGLEQQPWSVQLAASDPDVPFNGLTYTLVEGPSGLSVSGTGLVTWTPAEAQGPSLNTVTVKVTDGGEPPLSATRQFTIAVSEVNRPPEWGEILPMEINELAPMEFTLPGSDPDLPVNLLSYTLVSGPVGLVVSPAGLVTWTPTEGQAPSLNTVVVTVRDNGVPPLDATRQFSLRVREVNSAPTLVPVANQEIREMERLELSLSAGDADFPANTLRYSLVSGPDGLTVDGSGRLVWTPTEAQGPSENTVVVQVTDNGVPELSGTTQFTVTVREVNRPPVLEDVAEQTLAELEGWSLTLTVRDPDLPANLQTFALQDGPAGMTVSSDGVVRWTPDETQGPSTQRVTVTVVDNGTPPLSATNQFVVRVTEVNRPPDFAAVPGQVVDELSLLEYSLVAGDEDRPVNALTFSLVSGPTGLTVTPAGAVRWTPGEEHGPSTNTVVVRVLDDGVPQLGRTNEFIVVVREVNVPPVLPVPEVPPIREEELWAAELRATDADRPFNRLTYSLVSGPAGLTVSPEGAVSWTPGENQGPSTQQVTVAVTDSGTPPLSVTNQFTVVVTEVNRPPSITPVPRQGVDELALLEYALLASDPDLPVDTLTFSLVSGPAGLTVTPAGAVRWTPGEEQGPSTNTVVVRVTDDGAPSLSATHEFTVVVREINVPPVLPVPEVPPIREEELWATELRATDVDRPSNRLTYSLLSGPAGLTVSPEGAVSWTPGENQGPSTQQVTVAVTDSGTPPLSVTNQFSVAVTEVNRAPSITSVPRQVVEELALLEYALLASDPDLPVNNLTFSLVSGPTGLTVTPAGAVRWTPGEEQGPSTNTVVVRVTDNGVPSLSATLEFVVVVREVNSEPTFIRETLPPATELATWLEANLAEDGDLPPNRLTYSIVSGPDGVTVSPDGTLRWVPSEAQGPSTNTLLVRVTDDGTPPLSATQRYSIVVREVNSAPALSPVARQVTKELAQWELQLSATDADLPDNRLQYALVSGPPGLSVSGSGTVSWLPSEAQGPSTNVVLVRVFDDGVPSLASTNQWVVVVEEVNTPPVLQSPGPQVAEARQPWKVQLQAIDSDLPATPLTYFLMSGPPGLTVNSTGLVSWTPTASQNPSTNLVVVRVRDSGPGFLRDTNTFVVVVTDRILSPHLGIHLVVDQIIVDFETRAGWVYHLFSLPYTQAGKPNPAWELLTPENGLIGTGALEEFILPPDLPESGVLIRLTVTPPTPAAPSAP